MVWSPLTLALTEELELSVLVSAASETEGWETCSPQASCFSYSTLIQNLYTVYFLTYPI